MRSSFAYHGRDDYELSIYDLKPCCSEFIDEKLLSIWIGNTLMQNSCESGQEFDLSYMYLKGSHLWNTCEKFPLRHLLSEYIVNNENIKDNNNALIHQVDRIADKARYNCTACKESNLMNKEDKVNFCNECTDTDYCVFHWNQYEAEYHESFEDNYMEYLINQMP